MANLPNTRQLFYPLLLGVMFGLFAGATVTWLLMRTTDPVTSRQRAIWEATIDSLEQANLNHIGRYDSLDTVKFNLEESVARTSSQLRRLERKQARPIIIDETITQTELSRGLDSVMASLRILAGMGIAEPRRDSIQSN